MNSEYPYNLGKYRVESELGHGGFATVYRATDTTLDRDVALKILDPLLTRDPKWVRRFMAEARVVAKLNHPRIVTIHEVGDIDGRMLIAMQYLDGGTLANEIDKSGPMAWERIVALLSQVADALDYAHEQGVSHHDMKPGNVLLDSAGNAYLSDFGFARMYGESDYSVSISGGIVGTPNYMAPEVWEERDPGSSADIYALGCILYEMVTGKRLFVGDSIPSTMQAHYRPLQLPATWPQGVPAGIADVIQQAVAQEPDARFRSAGAMVQSLSKLADDQLAKPYAQIETTSGAVQSEALSAENNRPIAASETLATAPSNRRHWYVIGGVMVVLIVLGLVVINRIWGIGDRVSFTTPAESTIKQSDGENMVFAQPVELQAGSMGSLSLTTDNEIVMRYVPAGAFTMGSSAGGSDEQLVHEVTLDAFWIDETEVTNAQYEVCVTGGVCHEPSANTSYSRDSYFGDSSFTDYPVINVSWHDAQAFCNWRGAWLPTEAQWEKAAGGTDRRTYPWGERVDSTVANHSFNVGDTTEVRAYPAGVSPYGAYDMAGNVWEWTADWYADDYYNNSAEFNPAGPEDGLLRVLRGGAWNYFSSNMRVSDRNVSTPGKTRNNIGFRCAMKADTP